MIPYSIMLMIVPMKTGPYLYRILSVARHRITRYETYVGVAGEVILLTWLTWFWARSDSEERSGGLDLGLGQVCWHKYSRHI